jgi:hypothetical protein
MYHLSKKTIIGLCYRTLPEKPMLDATAHLSWCTSCRKSAESLGESLIRFDSWETPPLQPKVLEKILSSAAAEREQNIWWRRALRASGLMQGDSSRALRLLVTSACALSILVVGFATLMESLTSGKKVESQLIVHTPDSLLTGGTTVLAIEARSETDGVNVAGVPVSLMMDCNPYTNRNEWWAANARKERGVSISQEQKTNEDGVAIFTIKVPSLRDASTCNGYAEAEINGEKRTQSINVALSRDLKLHLSSDKPTYQPGQLIRVRGLALERGSSLPLADSPARIEFFDERGTRLSRAEGTISAQGIFSAELELSSEAALGDYRAVLSVERATTSISVKIERYTLPPFEVAVKPLATSTNGVEPFDVEVSAKYSFGEIVPSGTARLFVSYAGRSVATLEAPIKDGVAKLNVKGASWIAERAKYEGGVLSLRATVIDPASRAEEGAGAIVLTRDTLLVDLHSEARSLRLDLPAANKILLRTSRPDGSPVSAKVQVLSVDSGEVIVGKGELISELETDADGIGFVDLPPAFFGRQLAALVTDPKDNHQLWQVFPAPPVRQGSSILRCDQALLRAGQTISCDVYHASGRAVMVRALIHNIPVATALTKKTNGISQVKLTLPTGVSGLLRLEIEGASYEDATYALVAPEEGLQVSIAGNVPKKPGEEATLALRVTNDLGQPRVAAIGLALVDAAVFSRAGGVSPRQIIETIFASPGLAPELMALLFPTQELGKEGSQGHWTSQQQINARWLLSGVQDSFSPIQARSTLADDRYKLEREKSEALRFMDDSIEWMLWVLGAALVLALMVYSFTFRAVMLGALFAAPALFISAVFFDDMLEFKRDMSQLMAALTAFSVFIFTIWWVFKNRPDPLLSTQSSNNSQKILWAAGGVAFFVVGLIFIPVLSKGGYAPSYEKAVMQSAADNKPEEPSAPSAAMFDSPKVPEPTMALEAQPKMDPSNKKEAFDEDKKRHAGDEGKMGRAKGGKVETRVREDFPETLYYNAGIVTDEKGHAEVRFQVADSVTTWKVYALASDSRGFFGALEGGLEVFQEFFLDLDLPRFATVGDEFAMQVAVYNYQKDTISVSLRAETDPGATIAAAVLATPVTVKSGAVAGVLLPATLTASGDLSITITGSTATSADAVRRVVNVVPNGRETRQIFSGLALSKVDRKLGIPANALTDGRKIELTLFASSLALALDGMDQMLAEPHGCFEQVSSTTYPNALILKALKATGKSDPAIEAMALRYLRLGYQQLLPYEVPGGGFSYFGGSTQVPHLTAYALSEFTEMASLIEVDPELLLRTRMALVNYFNQSDSFGGPAQAAYITLAMVESDPNWNQKEDPQAPWDARVRQSRDTTKRAVERLAKAFSVTDSLDTYALALAANAFFATGEAKYHAEGMRLLDAIQSRGETITGEGGMIRYTAKNGSLYGSYGETATVETTALVARAFLLSGERADKAKGPLRALLSMRDSYSGTFYSTQGTILSLRALLAAAQAESGEGTVKVLVDGQDISSITFDAKTAYTVRTVDLSMAKPDSIVTIDATGASTFSADISYRLWVRYYTPWEQPAAPPIETIGESDPTLSLAVSLNKTSYRLGDIGTVTATLSRQGGSSSRGMILVELGMPPGFRLTPDALGRLESYPVKRVEQRARGVVLYIEDPGYGTNLTFQMPMVAVRGVKKVLYPRSRAYFYYQPWIESQAKPIQLNVAPK